MEIQLLKGYTAFAGARRVATGDLADVAIAAKVEIESGVHEPVLIFDNETGKVVDVDYRGSEADMLIAATAFEHRLTLVTRDVDDFGDCGIALLNPFR